MLIRSQNVHMHRLVLDDVAFVTEQVADRMARTYLKPGDVLLNITGASIGRVACFRLGARANVNQHVCVIRPRPEKLDSGFLVHFLAAPNFQAQIDQQQHGGTRQALTFSQISEFSIPNLRLEEQHRIAAILDKADAIRRKRREVVKLADAFLKSAFLEMFGDPVGNPRGWPVHQMDDVLSDVQYGTADPANELGDGLPVLRMNNLTYHGRIDLTNVKWCPIPDREREQYTVRRGDLLFNRTNSPELVGKTAVWNRDETYAFAGYLIRMRFRSELATPEYVSGWLNSAQGKAYLFSKAKASNNMSNFSAGMFRMIPVTVPPIAEQERFSRLVATVEKMRAVAQQAVDESDQLFDSLVERAFSGRL